MISYKSDLDLSPKDFVIVSQKERRPSNHDHQSYTQSVSKVTVETARVESYLRLKEAVRLYK
jgi:hypothetical protein